MTRPIGQTPHPDWIFPPPSAALHEVATRRPVTLPDARLFSHNGVVIDARNRLRVDLSPDFKSPPSGHRILDCHGLPTPRRIAGRVLSLVTPAAWKNYFHWMVNALPRLQVVDLGSFDWYFAPRCRPYHLESLEALGIPPARILPAQPGSHYQCDELTAVPPAPLHRLLPADVPWLRSLFGVSPTPPTRRLYISRNDAWRRRARNEAELLAHLEPLGFEAVTTTGLSVREQARLFARAEAVIAPHGAALTNLVFAPPTCRVLELLAGNFLYDQFERLSATCRLAYQGHISPTAETDPDFTLDLDSLLPLLTPFR